MAGGKIRAIRRAVMMVVIVAGAGCGLFDFDVTLAKQTFALDFGQQTGTMPAIACDASAGACDAAASFTVDTSMTSGVPSDVAVTLGCDSASSQCFAQVTARAVQTVGVIQDDSFSSKVERHSLGFVKVGDVAYTIPANTLTFDIPKVDVYVGPAGSTLETDAGVALLGSTDPIAAGATTTTPLHLIIGDDNPARPVIEHAVEHKQDFVFIVVASPRMNAGNPVPAGSIQIEVTPKLVVGL
jgi:hypothetical protein